MTQLTQADVSALMKAGKYEEVNRAREAGHLDALLGVPPEDTALKARATSGRITPEDVGALNRLGLHSLVVTATAEDRIDYPSQEK